MARLRGNKDYPHDTPSRTGVLLTNLGSPDAPTPAAVRRYLAEFLWDPRIVEIPRPIWWLILHGIVLRLRPKRSAHAYSQVWTERGAPLITISRAQVDAIKANLATQLGEGTVFAMAMRYGNPSIAAGLRELQAAGAQRILVFPLYPQYASSTTGTTYDAVNAELRQWRWLPALRFVNGYCDHPGYIAALARSVREHWDEHGQGEKLLMSFHGLPRRHLESGDPYYCHCQKTARLLAGALRLEDAQWHVSFQSRFGREEWLKPYTDATLKEWGEQGIAKVQVICPGFSADCLETLEEIALQNRDIFLAAGGGEFEYIPALNTREDHIKALSDIVLEHSAGWHEQHTAEADTQAILSRAKSKGALR